MPRPPLCATAEAVPLPNYAHISSIFGVSPVPNLQRHMRITVCAAQELTPLLAAAQVEDWPLVERHEAEIARLEEEADHRKKAIRLQLPSTYLLPVARADVFDLLAQQDGIADAASVLAELIRERQLCFPERCEPVAQDALQSALAACDKARALVDELDELLEAGFDGPQRTRASLMQDAVATLVRETTQKTSALRDKLRSEESAQPPLQIWFLYAAADAIRELARAADKAARRLQTLLA